MNVVPVHEAVDVPGVASRVARRARRRCLRRLTGISTVSEVARLRIRISRFNMSRFSTTSTSSSTGMMVTPFSVLIEGAGPLACRLIGQGKRPAPDWLLFRPPNFGREHLTLSLAAGRNKMRPAKFRSAASGARMLRDSLLPPDESHGHNHASYHRNRRSFARWRWLLWPRSLVVSFTPLQSAVIWSRNS
jgi:hypothetical protein